MKTLVHLFPELMNLYGEYANLEALARMLRAGGEEAEIIKADDAALVPWERADFLYIGSGTEKSLLEAAEELRPHTAELRAYIGRGGVAFATGGAGALFLEKIGEEGAQAAGLGLVPGEARFTKRVYGDIVCRCPLLTEPIVGSYNSGIELRAEAEPMLSVAFDSTGRFSGSEGYRWESLRATQLIGPLLQRNPALCAKLAAKLCGEGFTPELSGFAWAAEAHDDMLADLRAAARGKF